MRVLEPMGLAWGTDSQAFSDIATKYFNDPKAGGLVFDEDSLCQLNYVIVIGDGAMTNTGIGRAVDGVNIGHARKGNSIGRMEELRKKGIKSLYVAYGGGIKGKSMSMFKTFARAGSCETLGDKDLSLIHI